MERFYPMNVVLWLQRTIYGLKQAAKQYWKEMLRCFTSMQYEKSKADPCLYFKWKRKGLVIWMSWVDDLFVTGNTEDVHFEKNEMMMRFDCDDTGEAKEYVGCTVNRQEGYIRFTQPVILQSFRDEFDIPEFKRKVKTPMAEGTVLVETETKVGTEEQHTYRSGTGKLLHVTRWSRPEMFNSVRELTRFGGKAGEPHMKNMYRVMQYCLDTPNRGLTLTKQGNWLGDSKFKFKILGKSDSDYAKDPDTRRSVNASKDSKRFMLMFRTRCSQRFLQLDGSESEQDRACFLSI